MTPTSADPPILHMRPDVPPTFWDPESPQLWQPARTHNGGVDAAAVWTADGWDDANGSGGIGWERSRSSAQRQASRLHEFSQKHAGVPSGPDGPGIGSPKGVPGSMQRNPGRPDWHRMLTGNAGGLRGRLKSSERSERSDRSEELSAGSSDELTYPDEMSEVTEQDIIDTAERGRDRSLAVRAAAAHRSLGYADYLQLDKVLGAQRPQSAMFSSEAHDEMLFIVIHQAYELWFKQILHELDSVNAALSLSGGKRRVADADVSVCALRTGRICEILRVLVQQFAVLETMSAQGFNDFRDFLTPASGFQSAQFRTMENKLGMRPEQRVQHSGCPYYRHLAREAERVEVLEAERETGLLALAGAWLETLLDDCCGGFDFAAYMADAVEQAAVHDRAAIEQYPSVRRGPAACPATAARSRVEQKAAALEELEQKRRAHLKLFDKAAHDELIAKGARHLSFKATMACVFVESFALELSLQTAHRLVSNLVEIDELIARWRHRHSGMVLRMIGTKSGTGGSSGHAYLNAVQHKSRIFVDLCHCAHYLLPQHAMPPLPPAVRARLARRLDHADLVESPLMSRNASADALDALASAQRHRAKSFT